MDQPIDTAVIGATSMGIFLATLARSMPQFGMLLVLVLLPLQLLSGGDTPRENMPAIAQIVMLAAPTTHFVSVSQAILFRGAGIDVVWPSGHPRDRLRAVYRIADAPAKYDQQDRLAPHADEIALTRSVFCPYRHLANIWRTTVNFEAAVGA